MAALNSAIPHAGQELTPPGLYGPWVTQDNPGWHGDFTIGEGYGVFEAMWRPCHETAVYGLLLGLFVGNVGVFSYSYLFLFIVDVGADYNYEAIFYGVMSSNHPELMLSYPSPMLDFIPKATVGA